MGFSRRAASLHPVVTAPHHLRRWRPALSEAHYTDAPVFVVGNSLVRGQGADGVNGGGDWIVTGNQGLPAGIRKAFAATYGDPGDGFIFPDDPARMTSLASASTGSTQPAALRHNRLLNSAGKGIQFTVPTGITRVGVIQGNAASDVSATWTKDSVDQGAVTTLTNTNTPVLTYIAVAAGQVIQILKATGGNTTIIGLTYRTAQTSGVVVHRIGQDGYTVGDVLGGLASTVPNTLVRTTQQQTDSLRAHYAWSPTKGVVVMVMNTNEQSQQATAGIFGGVTLSLFETWAQQIVDQIVSDGHCVLWCMSPRSPNAATGVGKYSESEAAEMLRDVAASTDHVAFMDMGDVWGTTTDAMTAAQSAGLQHANSVHCYRRGYADWGRMVHRALTSTIPLSN